MLAKGIKRKYSEVEGEMGSGGLGAEMAGRCQSSLQTVQSHCLMNISLVKLHRSLHHVEPNLRHLVLVANTLRRLQDNMQAESSAVGGWKAMEDNSRKDSQSFVNESKNSALEMQGEDGVLSTMDASLYSSISTILEDLNSFEGLSCSPLPQAEDDQFCSPKDFIRDGSREESAKLTSSSAILTSSTYLLGDNLEDIFEDIDTSMYDSDPWASSNLLNFKTFTTVDTEEKTLSDGPDPMLELSDLDYLMDVLVGTQNC